MAPAAEVLTTVDPVFNAAADAASAPSMLGAVTRLVVALVLLCAATWLWFYWQRRVKGPTRHLEVLDRAFLARGASVTLIRVEERRLLVGVSPEGVRLIRDLDADPSGPGVPAAFGELLDSSLAGREANP